MAYASVSDVVIRIGKEINEEVCRVLLDDASVLIDASKTDASDDAKMVVSCNMVIRALQTSTMSDIPLGATQGSMSALGYSQSWTVSGGSVGELYLSKTDRRILGMNNSIGSHSPLEDA